MKGASAIMDNKKGHFCELCGERIQVFVHPHSNPRRRVRGKHQSRFIKDHTLCRRCWQSLKDSTKTVHYRKKMRKGK